MSIQPASGSAAHHMLRRSPVARIDGQWINISKEQEIVDAIRTDFREGRGFTVHVMNLDHVVKRRTDVQFRQAYEIATYVTCDGAPVAALARRQNAQIERTPGPDLIEPLCRLAATEKVPVYLFGSSPDALKRTAEQLSARCPGIDICGTDSPPQGFDPQSEAADAALDRMAAAGARLCLISLGSPKQEMFSRRGLDRHPQLGFLNIGAGVDFIAGTQVRAPELLRNNGLEWLWRLSTNPKRLGVRYYKCAAVLADLALEHARRRVRTAVYAPRGNH